MCERQLKVKETAERLFVNVDDDGQFTATVIKVNGAEITLQGETKSALRATPIGWQVEVSLSNESAALLDLSHDTHLAVFENSTRTLSFPQ